MTRTATILAALGLASVAAAQPAGIELRIDTRMLEVGEAVDVQLVCTNTGSPSTPQTVTPEGLDLELLNSSPSHSSQMSIVNGRTWRQSTYTYSMRIVASMEGQYQLGPISVEADEDLSRTLVGHDKR